MTETIPAPVGSVATRIALLSGPEEARKQATCTPGLAAGPWDFDAAPGYGPGASLTDAVPA